MIACEWFSFLFCFVFFYTLNVSGINSVLIIIIEHIRLTYMYFSKHMTFLFRFYRRRELCRWVGLHGSGMLSVMICLRNYEEKTIAFPHIYECNLRCFALTNNFKNVLIFYVKCFNFSKGAFNSALDIPYIILPISLRMFWWLWAAILEKKITHRHTAE